MLGMHVCMYVHDFDLGFELWQEWNLEIICCRLTVPGWQLVAYRGDGQVSEEHCIHGFSLVEMACRTI